MASFSGAQMKTANRFLANSNALIAIAKTADDIFQFLSNVETVMPKMQAEIAANHVEVRAEIESIKDDEAGEGVEIAIAQNEALLNVLLQIKAHPDTLKTLQAVREVFRRQAAEAIQHLTQGPRLN